MARMRLSGVVFCQQANDAGRNGGLTYAAFSGNGEDFGIMLFFV